MSGITDQGWRDYGAAYAEAPAKLPHTLSVTAEDIEESHARRYRLKHRIGYPTDRNYDPECDCPIGIALLRTFARYRDCVKVNPDALRVRFDNLTSVRLTGSYGSRDLPDRMIAERASAYFEATETMRAFMRQWDRRGSAQPHNFRLISA